MRTTNYFLRISTFLVAQFSLTASPLFADIWMTAPQICGGKAYSRTARAAAWPVDLKQRASLADKTSPAMSSSVFPGDGCDFVISLRVRLDSGAHCRLTLGKTSFEIIHSDQHTRLMIDGEEQASENDGQDKLIWTRLTIKRQDNRMVAQLNRQTAIDLGENPAAIKTIRLESRYGTIAVSHFTLTGELSRRDPK